MMRKPGLQVGRRQNRWVDREQMAARRQSIKRGLRWGVPAAWRLFMLASWPIREDGCHPSWCARCVSSVPKSRTPRCW